MIGQFKDLFRNLSVIFTSHKAKRCAQIKLSGKKVLILAPHPDDEVFGCGGLIAELSNAQTPPYIIVTSGGEASHESCCDTPHNIISQERRLLTGKALSVLGVPKKNIHFLEYCDGHQSEATSQEILNLKNLIDNINPDCIFVPHNREGWPDHLAIRKLGLQFARGSREVYEYCVWAWYYRKHNLDWKNSLSLKMSEATHRKKQKAIEVYSSALAPCGKPWIGVLPKIFIEANSSDCELFFRIPDDL